MFFSFKVAYRFLKSSAKQTFIIILGIAIGVSVQIFIGSLIGGLQEDLINTTIGNSSQITITSKNGFLEDYEDIIENTKNIDKNIKYISPTIDGSGSIIKGSDSSPILLRGFNFNFANDIYSFDEKLIVGSLPQENQVAIGSNLANSLNIDVLDEIEVLIPLIGTKTLEVSAIFDFNVSNINETWLILDLDSAKTIFNLASKQVNSIEIQLNDVFKADLTSNLISSSFLDETIRIDNWKESNGALLSGLQGQSTSSLIIQIFVMLSVILGIASVLAITVMQKSKQIGILKAMGLSDFRASKIFLIEGFLLGLFGAILGVVFGLSLGYLFSTFALDELENPIVSLFINPSFIFISAAIATLASTLAALIPARTSSKLSIIEVIRNG